MKKAIFIILPFVAILVFIFGKLTFKDMINIVNGLDLKIPNFVEVHETLIAMKYLFTWQADSLLGNLFNIFLGVTQIGTLLTECLKVAYHFVIDTIWNVVQILRAFALA